jgi:hypothetical protein
VLESNGYGVMSSVCVHEAEGVQALLVGDRPVVLESNGYGVGE